MIEEEKLEWWRVTFYNGDKRICMVPVYVEGEEGAVVWATSNREIFKANNFAIEKMDDGS